MYFKKGTVTNLILVFFWKFWFFFSLHTYYKALLLKYFGPLIGNFSWKADKWWGAPHYIFYIPFLGMGPVSIYSTELSEPMNTVSIWFNFIYFDWMIYSGSFMCCIIVLVRQMDKLQPIDHTGDTLVQVEHLILTFLSLESRC